MKNGTTNQTTDKGNTMTTEMMGAEVARMLKAELETDSSFTREFTAARENRDSKKLSALVIEFTAAVAAHVASEIKKTHSVQGGRLVKVGG